MHSRKSFLTYIQEKFDSLEIFHQRSAKQYEKYNGLKEERLSPSWNISEILISDLKNLRDFQIIYRCNSRETEIFTKHEHYTTTVKKTILSPSFHQRRIKIMTMRKLRNFTISSSDKSCVKSCNKCSVTAV